MAMFNNIYKNIINKVQKNLTVSEILTMRSVPVIILPSVSGKTYCILGGQAKLIGGSTPYNRNDKIHVVDFNVDINLPIARFSFSINSTENSNGLQIINSNLSNNIGSEIYLKLSGGDPTTGDLEYQITIFYSLL